MRLLANHGVQAVLAWSLAAYLGFALKTMRWTIENREPADAAVASPEGAIGCFWHSRIPLGPGCRQVLRDKPRRVLISMSRDGEFIARAMERLDFPAIRGSGAKKSDPAKAKGGARAFVEALKWIRSGGVMAVTPDGPRGPAEVMQPGVPAMARSTGVPVFLFGLAARPAFRLNSWDRTVMPLPFGRGAIVFDGPLHAPRDADEASLEVLRLEWQARLSAATRRAEALVA